MNNDMSYKGLGLVLRGRTWRAQKRIRKTCIHAYPGNGPILWLNTGCTDKKAAASIARPWITELEAEFDRIEQDRGAQFLTTITDEEIARLCDLWLCFSMETNEQQRQDGLYRDNPELVESGYVEEGAAMEARLDTRKTKEALARKALATGFLDDRIKIMPLSWLRKHGYQLEGKLLNKFCYAFAKRIVASVEAANKLDEGIIPIAPHVQQPYAPPKEVLSNPVPATLTAPLLSVVIDKFRATEVKKGVPMERKYSAVLPLFLKIIGDKHIDQLKQIEIEDFCNLICRLPPRWADIIRKRRITPQKLAAEDTPKTISPKTYEGTYIAALRPFLRYAIRVYGDTGFPRHLTVDGIKYKGNVESSENKQRALTASEIKHLFECDYMDKARRDINREHEFWLPLIGLYTGARVNEVCQLNPQTDIQEKEPGLWVFSFTPESETDERVKKSIKNKVSIRDIPVHSKLVELGFLKYVERIRETGTKLLFPMWPPTRRKAAGKAEKEFRGLLRKLNLRDDTPGKKVAGYHIFRHTMENRALNLGVDRIRLILGHAGKADDAFAASSVERGYEGEVELKVKKEILERIWFDLDLKPLPHCTLSPE